MEIEQPELEEEERLDIQVVTRNEEEITSTVPKTRQLQTPYQLVSIAQQNDIGILQQIPEYIRIREDGPATPGEQEISRKENGKRLLIVPKDL